MGAFLPTPTLNRSAIALVSLGAALVLACLALTAAGGRFDYSVAVVHMPIWPLVAGLIGAGAIYLAGVALVGRLAGARTTWLLAATLLLGLAMRVALLSSVPALEDDWQRYLWDGAVTAHGLNPYAIAPKGLALGVPADPTLAALKVEAGATLPRINHGHLRTIYPPTAQAAFALGYAIAPFELIGWRLVVLLADCATLLLILGLLARVQRPALWALVYWWNPLALKELYNSAHMDGIIAPFVLGALALSIARRPVLAALSLGLAVGAKVWPAIVLPVILRPLVNSDVRASLRAIAWPVIVFGLVCAAMAAPILIAGLDQTSGFVAYTQFWRTHSAITPILEAVSEAIVHAIDLPVAAPGVLARPMAALILGALMVGILWRPIADAKDLVARTTFVVFALVLLSPAQFPWYALWVLPLAPMMPLVAILALAITLPLYYGHFYLRSHDLLGYRPALIWASWLPIWVMMARHTWAAYRRIDTLTDTRTPQ